MNYLYTLTIIIYVGMGVKRVLSERYHSATPLSGIWRNGGNYEIWRKCLAEVFRGFPPVSAKLTK